MATIKHLETKWSIASYELIKACDPLELKFYLWLKLWAINKHSAFPSYTTICAELGIARSTLSRLLEDMVERHHLSIIGKGSKGGRNNVYDITWYDNMLVKNSVDRMGKTSSKTLPTSSETLLPTSSETGLELVERKTSRNITITTDDRNNLKKFRILKNPLSKKMSMNIPQERSRIQEAIAPAMRRS